MPGPLVAVLAPLPHLALALLVATLAARRIARGAPSLAATLGALALGLAAGAAASVVFARFARFEVPLSPTNLPWVIGYLVLVRGCGEELAKRAASYFTNRGNTSPPDALALTLALAAAFGAGLALDPAVHAFWEGRPWRPWLAVLVQPLLACPWAVALARGGPAAAALARAGWRHGLVAVLDRESGLPTVVLALLLAESARDAHRALAAGRSP